MDIALFVELLSSVGFPIVCVIALGWFVYKIYKRSEVREDELRVEISENRRINEKFADIISKYSNELTEIKEDVKEIKEDLISISEKIV